MISKEELENLLLCHFMSVRSISKKYNVDTGIVKRAVEICNISLDKTIWKRGVSYNQRQLLASNILLTEKQHQILTGSLLGDGSLEHLGINAKFGLTQSAHHLEYLTYIHQELKPFCGQIKEQNTKNLKNVDKLYKTYYFYTTCHSEFTKYRNLFYPKDIKIVPENIEDLLTELSLGIWYCEDGAHTHTGRGSILHTNCFIESEVEHLITVLYRKFNIKTHLLKVAGFTEKQSVIYIGTKEGYDIYHDIVDPFVQQFPCFHHKLRREKVLRYKRGIDIRSAKLTEEEVREIRKLAKKGINYPSLALKYGVGREVIGSIVNRKSWKHVK